jgi:HSP90 family molecular chaperone
MSEHIRVEGWQPCSVKIHVDNVEGLVKSLAGANLYGHEDQLGVALRELIQNARDAVAARQALENDYVGKIRVQLKRK